MWSEHSVLLSQHSTILVDSWYCFPIKFYVHQIFKIVENGTNEVDVKYHLVRKLKNKTIFFKKEIFQSISRPAGLQVDTSFETLPVLGAIKNCRKKSICLMTGKTINTFLKKQVKKAILCIFGIFLEYFLEYSPSKLVNFGSM